MKIILKLLITSKGHFSDPVSSITAFVFSYAVYGTRKSPLPWQVAAPPTAKQQSKQLYQYLGR
jgi:hypothetical protein